MKPITRKAMPSTTQHQDINTGPIVAKIQGSTLKLGVRYKKAIVVLYNKANLQPIAVRRPDENGNYSFLGLNTSLKTFVVAFDRAQEKNAIIQDNVVPK